MAERPAAIGVCCIRDALDPTVWSRTPRNICDQLKARGRLGPSIYGLPHAGMGMKIRAVGTALQYGRPRDVRRFLHGRGMRRAHARHMARLMASSGVRDFLHFAGDRYLPLCDKPAGTRHFLVLDSTWDYWRDGSLPAGYLEAVDTDIRAGYHQMDHLFAIAEHTKQSLITRYEIPAAKITVVGTGRGIIAPYEGPKDYGDAAILFVAKERFEDKGGKLLYEAFKIARQKNAALKLWLVGDPAMRELAAGDGAVSVFGFLPIGELQGLFNRAALFAMPAPREPWGLVFLEALTCRTPILGLDRGALREISLDQRVGFAVSKAEPAAVADALLDAFSDPARLARMGAEGQKYTVEHFTWEKTADRIISTLDALA